MGSKYFWICISIVKATVSGIFEDLKFKISEGSDQNWSYPGSVLLAVSAKRRQPTGQDNKTTRWQDKNGDGDRKIWADELKIFTVERLFRCTLHIIRIWFYFGYLRGHFWSSCHLLSNINKVLCAMNCFVRTLILQKYGGFNCTFSLLISLSITLQTCKFRNQFTISSKCFELVSSDVILLNLKRIRTKIGLLLKVLPHIKIFWTDCELIPEVTSSQCNWKENRKGKGTDETPLGLLLGLVELIDANGIEMSQLIWLWGCPT